MFVDDEINRVVELAEAAHFEAIESIEVLYRAAIVKSPSTDSEAQLVLENQEIKEDAHIPEFLHKFVFLEQWSYSLLLNEMRRSEIDDPFIHLTQKHQIMQVVQKFWNNLDYILLKLSVKKLMGRLVYETNRGGSTKYYHLNEGKIPLDAVEDVTIFHINHNYEVRNEIE